MEIRKNVKVANTQKWRENANNARAYAVWLGRIKSAMAGFFARGRVDPSGVKRWDPKVQLRAFDNYNRDEAVTIVDCLDYVSNGMAVFLDAKADAYDGIERANLNLVWDTRHGSRLKIPNEELKTARETRRLK